MKTSTQPSPAIRHRFTRALLGFIAVLLVLWAAQGFATDLFRWKETTSQNPAFLEGLAWWHGQLALPYRLWDTAWVAETGRTYNVFPPLQSIIAFLTVAAARVSGDPAPFPESQTLPLVLFTLLLPIVGYDVFLRQTGSVLWGAILTLGWLGGTAVLPCLYEARNDGVHHINHLLSQIGLLLLANELLGRRRLWIALLGLAIAAWSRQLTAVFAVALLVETWLRPPAPAAPAKSPNRPDQSSERQRRPTKPLPASRSSSRLTIAATLLALAFIAAVPMSLNRAKFGSPFRDGYKLIYAGRDHDLARAAQEHGLFSPHFLVRDAYYMNLALPWTRGDDGRLHWKPSELGASLWLGTPLLVLVLLGVRTWWREPAARVLMLCTVPIIAALLLYHGTGQRQFGYWRFSLDFIPIWLVVAAPWLTTGWRRWPTIVGVTWSLAYFAMAVRWSPLAAS